MRRFCRSTCGFAVHLSLSRWSSAEAALTPNTTDADQPLKLHSINQKAPMPLTALLASLAAEMQTQTSKVAVESPQSALRVPPDQFLDSLSNFIINEERLQSLCRSKVTSVRRHFLLVRARRPFLSSAQRDVLLNTACAIVERRDVSLLCAARLLRPRWSDRLMDLTGTVHHRFLLQSLRAWTSASLSGKTLDPITARKLLTLSPHLFSGQLALLGAVVEAALVDLDTMTDVDLIIQIMWAIHTAGMHAPDGVWRRLLSRLTQLNRNLRGRVTDAIDARDGVNRAAQKSTSEKTSHAVPFSKRKNPAHVFSGLTTRQLFRTLRVLRRERWCGDVAALHDLADQALKNIVFETEALGGTPADPSSPTKDGKGESNSSSSPMGRRAVVQRVELASGLTPAELLSLLTMASDLGVACHATLSRVSDLLLAPMVPHLRREPLMLLTNCVRRANCDSPCLVQAVLNTAVVRGPTYPFALGLGKAALRAVVQRPSLLSQLSLGPFLNHLFSLCEASRWGLRASQLLGWMEVFYGLSRRYTTSSSTGLRVRQCVESLLEPIIGMLELRLVPTNLVERVLEHTVILGMRHQPQFPLTSKLRDTYVALANQKEQAEGNQTSKEDFPNGSVRAAREVYDELIYTYERQLMMRSPISKVEEARFRDIFLHVGLYNLFSGARLMQMVHMQRGPTTPNAFSAWVERTVGSILEARLREAKLTSQSSNEDVLRILGQLRCDRAKLRRFVKLLEESPLLFARQQRCVAEFALELTKRFGGDEEQAVAKRILDRALY